LDLPRLGRADNASVSEWRVTREQSGQSTYTRCRLFAQVDFRREMRPTAFVDPGAFLGTSRGVPWRKLRPRLHAFDC